MEIQRQGRKWLCLFYLRMEKFFGPGFYEFTVELS
jgi:hypothetical protein